MKLSSKIAALAVVGALSASPALAQPSSFPGEALDHVSSDTPAVGLHCLAVDANWPPSGDAFRACVRQSVTALRAAKRALREDRTDSLRGAARMGCAKAGFSRRPEAGESRSEHGKCVSAVVKALSAQRRAS
jgi:hypothetical protein